MNRTILYTLIGTAIFLAITAAVRHAGTLGYLGEETIDRAVQVMIGLGLALWSNFTPKQIGPVGPLQVEAWKQRLLRLTGWSMMLAGLAYAALHAFAPLDIARTASIIIVAAAMALTLAYTVRVAAACRKLAAQ